MIGHNSGNVRQLLKKDYFSPDTKATKNYMSYYEKKLNNILGTDFQILIIAFRGGRFFEIEVII
jgi:hypothetical protein